MSGTQNCSLKTSDSDEEITSLKANKMLDVNVKNNPQTIPINSGEVAKQDKTFKELLTRQLENSCKTRDKIT